MAYNATSSTLNSALADVDQAMKQIGRMAKNASTALLSNVTADEVLMLYENMFNYGNRLQTAADNAPTGLNEYAQEQRADPTADPVGASAAVKAEVDALVLEIETTLPTSAGGYLAIQTIANGDTEWRTFTPPQTSGIKGHCDNLKAMIE